MKVSTSGRSLEITNSGPAAFAPEDLEALLGSFVRGGQDRTSGTSLGKKRAGLGLGLAIVREIASVHNASLLLSPVAGGGLCVRVEFPEPGIEAG